MLILGFEAIASSSKAGTSSSSSSDEADSSRCEDAATIQASKSSANIEKIDAKLELPKPKLKRTM